MRYLLDTVALVRHFSGIGKLGSQATDILNSLERSDDTLIVSVISLMEVMYLAEKKRISINLTTTLELLASSAKYIIVDLTAETLKVAETVQFAELHDRLLLATAKQLGIKIISSDAAFSQVEGIEVVWDFPNHVHPTDPTIPRPG